MIGCLKQTAGKEVVKFASISNVHNLLAGVNLAPKLFPLPGGWLAVVMEKVEKVVGDGMTPNQ